MFQFVPAQRGKGPRASVSKSEKEEREWRKLNRRPYEIRDFPDIRFKRIDKQQMARNSRFWETDPTVGIAHRMASNAVFGGGISCKRGGKPMQGAEAVWFAATYTKVLRRAMLHDIWCYGFTPVIITPHPEYVGEPKVLNVEDCEILYHNNIFNEEMWVFIEHSSSNNMFVARGSGRHLEKMLVSNGVFGGRIVQNVWVYCVEKPTSDGQINSHISRLIDNSEYTRLLRDYSVKAGAYNSNPPLVTERKDPNLQREPTGAASNRVASSGSNGSGSISDEARMQQRAAMQADMAIQRAVATANSLGVNVYEHMKSVLAYSALQSMTSAPGRRVDLDDDRKLASGPQAQAPENLMDFLIYQQQVILMLLGTPPALIQPESTRGRLTENNSLTLYHMDLRNMKQEMTEFAHGIYQLIHYESDVLKYLTRLPLEEKADRLKVAAATDVVINLPGVPPEDKLMEMYTMGLLKYEAYVRLLSQAHAMDPKDFEASPQIDRIDLIGQGKPEPAQAKKPVKSKAKSKSGSSSKSKAKSKAK